MSIKIKNAYFVKLGSQGKWESSSIKENIIRIGWANQSTEDINSENWSKIEKQLKEEIENKGAATRDLNALKKIAYSTPDDIWITFYASQMWWCRVDNNQFFSDDISKYRKLSKNWSPLDINGNKLLVSTMSGKLSKIQGFRGTICDVKETEYLTRLLNDEPSAEYIALEETRKKLILLASNAIQTLHWSDFEALVDIIFTRAGWQRISHVGKVQTFIDLEYREPITNELYQVQVKSSSNLAEFLEYAKTFNLSRFKKLYFVVHSPEKQLLEHQNKRKDIELILTKRLGEMAVDYGLLGWLMEKIS